MNERPLRIVRDDGTSEIKKEFLGVLECANPAGLREIEGSIDLFMALAHGRLTRALLEYVLAPMTVRVRNRVWQYRLATFGRPFSTEEGIERLGKFQPADEKDFDLLCGQHIRPVKMLLALGNDIILLGGQPFSTFGPHNTPESRERMYVKHGPDNRLIKLTCSPTSVWQPNGLVLGVTGPLEMNYFELPKPTLNPIHV